MTTTNQRYSSVAALNDGGFVVTWSSWVQDGSDFGIYGQRFDAAGSAVGIEFQINTTTSGEQQSSFIGALETAVGWSLGPRWPRRGSPASTPSATMQVAERPAPSSGQYLHDQQSMVFAPGPP